MSAIRKLLASFALPFARVYYRFKPGARILMYHRISQQDSYDQLSVHPQRFEEQIRCLSKHYEVLPLDDLLAKLRKGMLGARAVAITFDDGYLDNLEQALPVLEKYQVPATIYITSNFAAQTQSHPRYNMTNERLHLSWQEIAVLANHPLISIGSHTVSHPMLSELSDADAAKEICQSKSDIEAHIGREVRDFCYPSGNFTDREKQFVADAGYVSAVSVKPGSNHSSSDWFALKRTEVTDRDGVKELQQKLDGAFDVFHWMLDIKRELVFSRQRCTS